MLTFHGHPECTVYVRISDECCIVCVFFFKAESIIIYMIQTSFGDVSMWFFLNWIIICWQTKWSSVEQMSWQLSTAHSMCACHSVQGGVWEGKENPNCGPGKYFHWLGMELGGSSLYTARGFGSSLKPPCQEKKQAEQIVFLLYVYVFWKCLEVRISNCYFFKRSWSHYRRIRVKLQLDFK